MRDIGRCAESVVATVVRGRYEESLGAMKVIGRQEKLVVAMEVISCYANSLVAMHSQRSLWRGYGFCGKSAVAVGSQWLVW
jgi:hypothetical protein